MLAAIKPCSLKGLNKKNLLSHSSGGWKSEIQVPVELGSPEVSPPWLVGGYLLAVSHLVPPVSTQSVFKFPLLIRTPAVL